jgi:hypothetical protein
MKHSWNLFIQIDTSIAVADERFTKQAAEVPMTLEQVMEIKRQFQFVECNYHWVENMINLHFKERDTEDDLYTLSEYR